MSKKDKEKSALDEISEYLWKNSVNKDKQITKKKEKNIKNKKE
jgi:hypothetical protein